MKTREGRGIVIALCLAFAILISACGTLQIDTEPTASQIDAETVVPEEGPTATPTQRVMTTPTWVIEEGDMATEAPAASDTAVVSGAVVEATADASSEIQSYTNAEYGFTFSYPSSWSLAEVNDADFVGPGSRSVQLSQGTVKLVIGYRQAGEEVAIGGSGAPAGELVARGSLDVLGQEVDRNVIVYEGEDKAVMYGQPGAPIAASGLEFAPRMDDFARMDYEETELSQSVQDDADFILSSLALIEAEEAGDETTAAADYDYSGWQSYTNETLGYSLMYPGQADIMGADRDKAVDFVGPIAGDDHWPWFMVQHFDSDFFRPPAGTDVRQWIAGSDIPYKAEAQETTIGGLPAVQLRVEPSPQAYGMDEYYVIDGDQLYKITILHAGGLEDWTLYDQFLQSIAFDSA